MGETNTEVKPQVSADVFTKQEYTAPSDNSTGSRWKNIYDCAGG